MTHGTITLGDRLMGGHDRRCLARSYLMTTGTDCALIINQHAGERRPVWFMALVAGKIGERRMHGEVFKILKHRSVTSQTQFVGFTPEQTVMRRAMGFVAGITSPDFDRYMRCFLNTPLLRVTMAFGTQIDPVRSPERIV